MARSIKVDINPTNNIKAFTEFFEKRRSKARPQSESVNLSAIPSIYDSFIDPMLSLWSNPKSKITEPDLVDFMGEVFALSIYSKDNSDTSQTTGTLPAVNKADYAGKEGLVTFKDLAGKGYTVSAKYVNEAVPATNQDLTEQFTSADVNSCSDRLGFDAYTVSDLTQTGDSVALTLGNTPNSNQTCPAGTTDDLN